MIQEKFGIKLIRSGKKNYYTSNTGRINTTTGVITMNSGSYTTHQTKAIVRNNYMFPAMICIAITEYADVERNIIKSNQSYSTQILQPNQAEIIGISEENTLLAHAEGKHKSFFKGIYVYNAKNELVDSQEFKGASLRQEVLFSYSPFEKFIAYITAPLINLAFLAIPALIILFIIASLLMR